MNDARSDMYAVPPLDGDWTYEVDGFGTSYGPGWRPLYRDGQPVTVRLAPNAAHYAWGTEYVLASPTTGAGASARLTLSAPEEGRGVVDTRVALDLRERAATVHPDRPPRLRTQADAKAQRTLRLLLTARRERRRRASRPTTAHDRWTAREES